MRPATNHTVNLGWLLLTVAVVLAAQLALAGAAAADDPKSEPTTVEEPLSFVVDESLAREEGVATIADSHGDLSDFAADELVVATDDPAAFDKLLSRRNGKVLRSFDPAEHGFDDLRPRYLVHIEASEVDPERLVPNLEALGIEARGEHRLSSKEALGLFAVAAEEAVEGMTVGLNWLAQGHTIRTRTTTEAPSADSSLPLYTPDAYRWGHFANGTVQDTGIGEAWTLLGRASRLPAPGTGPRIGILDGGFAPFDADIPVGSVQLSSGLNPGVCSGGVACPFHGSNVTSTAMALVDNRFGSAGAGGPAARAIQLNSGGDMFTTANGLLTLRGSGARIINMSFGGTLPAAATGFTAWFDAIADAVRFSGAVLVASAGNAGSDVDALDCFLGACWEGAYFWPCETPAMLCVGGLGNNSKSPHSSSNFGRGRGTTVDIWAPWFAISGVDPLDPAFLVSPNTAKNFSGTSASAPVVSGVAALILAAAPSLTPAQVESTLLSTAQPGVGVASSTIDAEAALFSALVPFLPPDMRIQQPTNGSVFYIYRNPRFGWSGDTIDLRGTSIRANSLTSPLPDVQVDWTATGANGVKPLGKGHANSVNALDLGEGIHTITFRGTDPPLVGTDSVTIEVRLWRPIVCDPICS